MKISDKELLGYGVLALIIIIAVYIYASSLVNPLYSISVSMQSLTHSSGTFYPYQVQSFKVTVNNTGPTTVRNMVVGIYLNNVGKNTFTVTVPAQSSTSFNASYRVASNGTFLFQAIADPGNLLNIRNRSSATASYSLKVTASQVPNVYTSIPNSNIIRTENFSVGPYGLDEALFVSTKFNTTEFNSIVGNGDPVSFRVLALLSPYVATDDGAYTVYSNSSVSFVSWLQGAVNMTGIRVALYTINSIKPQNVSILGAPGIYARENATTSFCAYPSNGWTKLLLYKNSSSAATCLTVLAAGNYSATQPSTTLSILNQDPSTAVYRSKFVYLNSTIVGSSLIFNSTQHSVASFNLFQTGTGFFGAYIKHNIPPIANISSQPLVCYGPVFATANSNVCSTGVSYMKGLPFNNTVLLNSTEITSNYTVHLYSLINRSVIDGSHTSAGSLITYLGFNGIVGRWNANLKSTCQFNATNSIGCGVNNFTANSVIGAYILNVSLVNMFGGPIRINRFGCAGIGFGPAMFFINQTLANNSSMNTAAACVGYTTSLNTPTTSYQVTLNYTRNGATTVVNGTATMPNA